MPVFAGLDLAWTRGRPSGICILAEDAGGVGVERIETLITLPTAFAQTLAALDETVYAAIDAPLIISPERRAEGLLARRFGRAKAYAYHVSRDWLERHNALAGPQLGEALAARGFVHATPPAPRAPGRFMLEAFPHATHVALFGLAERMKYKRGPLASRAVVMAAYQAELGRLLHGTLPSVASDPRIRSLLDPAAIPATGREMKTLEDRLDALTCAVAAHHAWQHGPAGLETFGTPEHGQITIPLPMGSITNRES